jgi:DNA-binding transcriptional ArsR family regulator
MVKTLNSKLRETIFRGPRPPPDPLTPAELRKLEGRTIQERVEFDILDDEPEIIIDLDDWKANEEEKAAKSLISRILERGAAGTGIEKLATEMDREKMSPPSLRAVLEKLTRDGMVTESASGKIIATSLLKSTGNIHEIKVEKIRNGYAVVNVDDTWSATLMHEDYDGPRNLVKRNSRFRASSRLYSSRGVLYIRVNGIMETLN